MKDSITAYSNIGEMLERWPHLAKIFLEYRMGCPGCYLSYFEYLVEALDIYGLPFEPFVKRLNNRIHEPD